MTGWLTDSPTDSLSKRVIDSITHRIIEWETNRSKLFTEHCVRARSSDSASWKFKLILLSGALHTFVNPSPNFPLKWLRSWTVLGGRLVSWSLACLTNQESAQSKWPLTAQDPPPQTKHNRIKLPCVSESKNPHGNTEHCVRARSNDSASWKSKVALLSGG